jgi:hypothetical protein
MEENPQLQKKASSTQFDKQIPPASSALGNNQLAKRW